MITVSVIVPCYNERATIPKLLEAIHAQTYPINELEVVIADGCSTDDTRHVIEDFEKQHPDLQIKVIDNLLRVIPSGLNRAIEAAQGEYIVRMDAHSIPCHDYIEKCIQGLEAGAGSNVGGIWIIEPGASTWIAQAISAAASHPLGAGDARYRIGGSAQEVDTVPFGAFKKQLVDKIGMFDETLLTNEDYEFNVRVREAGGKVWLDPAISSIYYARATLRELSRQYWRYGYWKAQMLRRYPHTLRWRQLLPPVFVLSLICSAILALAWLPARWLLALIVIVYTISIFSIGIQMSFKHKKLSHIIGVPLALTTIHWSWGSAFLWGSIRKPYKNEPVR